MNETTYTDDGESVTIRVSGTAYRSLVRIASVMNGVGWCDNDNTASKILDEFIIGYWIRQLETPTGKIGDVAFCGVGETIDNIASWIDTGFEDGTPEDNERRAELKAAFAAAAVFN